MQAIIFLLIGAAAAYLYMNNGDTDKLASEAKTITHKSAQWVVDKTKDIK